MLGPNTQTTRAQIIRFWRTVEMFSPQGVEKTDPDRLVFPVSPGQPLPWEKSHQLARRKLHRMQAWQHVVYLGIYRLDRLFEELATVFKPDQDSYDERPAGESALAAFVVDENGSALPESVVLSSCAWATGKVVRDKHLDSGLRSEFQDVTSTFRTTVKATIGSNDFFEDRVPSLQWIPHLMDHELLASCLETAAEVTGIDTLLSCTEIRIKSQIVARSAAQAAGSEFLNSFIMSDLDLVADETANGSIGVALRDYLRPEADITTRDRVNVRDRTDAVLTATAPDTVPAGRWPSQPEHALALNQQLAVNEALSMTDGGVRGVNGPPGTGKTTMLRDLVAALVVERARQLAALTDPRQAFTGRTLRWRTATRTRTVNVWRPALTGFEMVVASANNGAVQNVTDEIPAAGAIGESWREQAAAVDYFPDVATALLAKGPDATATPVTEHAWALVAARLGNKSNRSRFVDRFWYHTPDKPTDRPADKRTGESDDGHRWSGLLSVLKEYEQTGPDVPWPQAVAQFRAAETRVARLRRQRSEVYRNVQRRAQLGEKLADLRHAVKSTTDAVEAARLRHTAAVDDERARAAEADRFALTRQAEAEQDARQRLVAAEQSIADGQRHAERLIAGRKATAERAVRSWEAELSRRWQTRAAHQQSRPSLWEWLRTLGEAYRSWSHYDRWLLNEVHRAQASLDAAHAESSAAQREIDAVHQGVDDARREADAIKRKLDAGIPKPKVDHPPLAAARRSVESAAREVSAASRVLRETEDAVRAADSELAALDVTLARAADALGRHYPDAGWHTDRPRREMVAPWTDKDWNTARSELFLAALALHKAFLRHSAAPLRRNLQAAMDLVSGDAPDDVPADAALAAWQSLFFVVPVVSTTFASYARLFGHLGKEALGWLLIDEAGQATPQNAVGALWRTRRAVVVGDPLQLEPITTLPFPTEQAIRDDADVDEQWSPSRTSVQRLADRLTPLGTWLTDADDSDPTWVGVPLTVHRRCDQPMFDIVNQVAYDGLMIDGTGTAARESFRADYPTLPPSKWIDVPGSAAQGHWIPDQGRQLDRVLGTLADLGFDMSEVMVIGPFRDVAREIRRRTRRYPDLVAGTVHTAQGKQADVVVFVLGGAPDRLGALRWASNKPNLLNVAVSRAKRRLYVIGDRKVWSTMRYFDVLAAKLPHQSPIEP
ncbi:AAA domain-containing protein [Solwaraspora sp. WMMD406]|uniref:AAA domain-containing protein n=1 Tax=Solwaraspora sp. WMMD406 TaxID=3016095 RepID=UPI002415B4DB|nr:AAA domain-containing protein [Solwaraspora sp. WMMD406]MDG4767714.1 AAA domain-containing protein [Solwaraspora sp. WMMD406]